jgi:hypothetical protein
MKIQSMALAAAMLACSVFAMRSETQAPGETSRPSEAALGETAPAPVVPQAPARQMPGVPGAAVMPGQVYPTGAGMGMVGGPGTMGMGGMGSMGMRPGMGYSTLTAKEQAALGGIQVGEKIVGDLAKVGTDVLAEEARMKAQQRARNAEMAAKKAEKEAQDQRNQEIFDRIMNETRGASDAASKAIDAARTEIKDLKTSVRMAAELGIDTNEVQAEWTDAKSSLKDAEKTINNADTLLANALGTLQPGQIPLIKGAYNSARKIAEDIGISDAISNLEAKINAIKAAKVRASTQRHQSVSR